MLPGLKYYSALKKKEESYFGVLVGLRFAPRERALTNGDMAEEQYGIFLRGMGDLKP